MPTDVLTVCPAPTGTTWVIQSEGYLQGKTTIPGDKSISHRALMLGALASGETTIQGLLLGEDPRSTAHCFRALGAEISELNTEHVRVQGIGLGHLLEPDVVLDAGNSGTTLRLMLGILASHPDRLFTVTGDTSLCSRPMGRVIKPLQQMGAHIWGRQSDTLAPLAIRGQQLQPIHYPSPIASAQVKSCIMFAGLMAEGQTTITEPALSRDHSERMFAAFGANIIVDPDTCSVTVTGPAQLHGQAIIVPGDISSAAFWLVAAAIVPGSDIWIENVGVNPTRTGVLEVLEQMGAKMTLANQRTVAGEPVADIHIQHSQLHGTVIEGAVIPRLVDEVPILAVAALFAQGPTTIRDAAELRVKESDRLTAMATQLQKMGANITEQPDGLEIQGGASLQGADVDSFGDHRVGMSLAIAALNATGSTTIHRAEAAAISYPNFVATLQQLWHS
ncbi:3-phosphoshikimate 1-carboxyvinyltransferase [Acaryochloris marina]|uniref:3-phosphoshikimate 1-carboxyvinyltransferase n=1 Tax=Acaryochloris marina (strain MBIC 11017) TaxID=329726 RepID=AROA_ACAM1|nr:3-phosphoshikimate 1-carboxyvinyltransferase [Acaryochloris marina]B0C218.1 RecName: Full=3-phosphoshikimate 1-carboxyvinyltransferase; AltName: Full=5-enolpyruvylshikimate-3-phosphate synthase; Short=EPSP synthase; Short=EPSPS [Acaryochloris marina MBIC11017]ABW27319.1 3-phosphoshikimate 1-carboxyvinyltransferase [Acaryochloris marina MBIC11017]BDM82062.1 3-phosphoshikimate 1-carboxyvinyltransferase [Acaryochloris marina MBIC10699]